MKQTKINKIYRNDSSHFREIKKEHEFDKKLEEILEHNEYI